MARGGGPIDVETVSRNQLEPVFAIDVEGTIAFANERFYAVSNLTPEDAIGSNYDVFEVIVEDGFDAFRSAVESVMAGESDEERVELSMFHPTEAPVPRRLPAETRISPIRVDGRDAGVLVTLRTVGTRKKYEKQLERQNDRLSEFASVVAHDLRNPLNVAEGHLRIASEECDSEHLDAVGDALSRMWDIIENTLALAKQGRYVGEKKRVDLETFARRCWTTVGTADASLEVAAERRSASPLSQTQEDGEDVSILADADRLQNLFENLFRNSVEHAADSVTVRVGRIDEEGFYVEDDGPGIPPEKRERVFDMGYSTAEEGTGYGLAIVRWIAEAHGWEVSVTDGTDGGARFEFTGAEFVQ